MQNHDVGAAFAPVAQAVEARRITGAVIGYVGVDGSLDIRGAGYTRRDGGVLVDAQTWFDLASLTKVLVTTPAIMAAASSGWLDLDAPLSSVIPDLRQYDTGAWERSLTFRQCLTHNTPLPAVEPLYTYGLNPATLRAFILQREWRQGEPCYSDINFMLLGIAIERLQVRGFEPPPLAKGLSFTPAPEKCAATEACAWRGRVLQGEVHDENAFALGGRPGHAGLFGTIDGVLNFALSVLRGEGLDAASLTAIRTVETRNRTLGWEARAPGWFGGDACRPGVIGHTGFTGTALWVDFDRGRAWALLTNRVHPTRHGDTGIAALRRHVGDVLGT